MAYMHEDRRFELALPARLLLALMDSNVFAIDPDRADEPGAAEKAAAEVRRLRELLTLARDEPLASLPLERTRPPKAALDEIMDSLR